MRNNALRLWLLAALLCCVQSLAAQSNSSLEKEFLNPSGDNKPWTLWYWMYGAVTEEALTADLEAMQGAGLGGAHLVTIRSSENPRGVQFEGQADQLTENWWKMVRHTIRECDRLGLQLAVHIADGFALAGGPWISPEESMQKVVFAETAVEGGEVHLTLAKPAHYPDYYRDIALYAIPERYAPIEVKPRVSCETLAPNATEKQRANIDEKGVIRAGARCRIDLTYDEVVEVRNVEIILSGNNYQAHRLKIYASENGTDFRYVTQLEPARHGWQNNDSQSTHAIVPTRGKVFRFEWDPEGSEPGAEDLDAAKWKANLKIKEILLGSEPRLHQWEGKSGQVWRVARETTDAEIPAADCLQADDMIDLTAALNGDELRCTLPAGQWRLVRLGHTSTGHTNATGGAGIGLECDKFSRAAVSEQIEGWFGAIYRSVDEELAKRVIKLLYVDSWECGSQNWSANFAAEFKARRGYDLKPYLLLYAGIPVESAARSEEVMRDIRTTIGELIHDVFFTVLAEKADQYGCRFTAESVAPTMISDGMYHYDKVDIPMGEFWLNSPTHDKPNDMLDAISGGHVYGKQVIAAEGFTTLRGVWNESPATLKPLLDYNYALGLNRLAYHVYTHNPWLNRKPGMTLDGIGLFYQRDNTWWEHGAKGMNDYVARCQALLQWGRPVVDIAVFTGEEMPRRSILPDRLVPSLPGLFGKERVESERLRLENKGVPTRVKPVGVTHSANMADPEDWVNPLRGYAYDAFNRDALLRLGEVKEGRLTTPGEWGGSYKVFVVPDAHPMNPENKLSDEVKAKIEALKKGGVIVPEIPYTPEDFAAYGLERDAVLPENIAWCHRQKGDENTDIYFLANQSAEKRSFTASLRVAGRVPELWNPLTGEIVDAATWRVVEGRTEVDLTLEGYGSIFVVLRRAGAPAEVKAMKQRVTPLKTTSDWWLTFELEDEGVRTERAKELFDWSTFSEDRIRYFSGTVVYRTTFSYKGKGERVVLRLGELYDVAAVKVNGKACGIVWTAPYEVDITEAVKRGENQLIIEVQNTWANALLGADTGKAPYRRIWTNATYRRAEKDLLPAGLIGPLELVEMKN
ncbi:MAG: glycosyl hydrolase [Rikenellaceae bacterium]|nr:glycosyl hydrolase [Rikenellaceae bacterium]